MFYPASERRLLSSGDLPLRSIPPTALRLWAPPSNVPEGEESGRYEDFDPVKHLKELKAGRTNGQVPSHLPIQVLVSGRAAGISDDHGNFVYLVSVSGFKIDFVLCVVYIVYLTYFSMNLDWYIVFSNILYTFVHNIHNYEL